MLNPLFAETNYTARNVPTLNNPFYVIPILGRMKDELADRLTLSSGYLNIINVYLGNMAIAVILDSKKMGLRPPLGGHPSTIGQ